MTKITKWHGCYDGNLKDLIVPEAFKHPAKMSRKLCERIFDYGREQGYWKPGDTIIDPFGGIGTTGIIGAYRGYHVICVELEEEFVKLAWQNFELNWRNILALRNTPPFIVQGDSRKLLAIFGQANGCVTSPPYSDGCRHTGGKDPNPEHIKGGEYVGVGIKGSISSPPYVNTRASEERNFISEGQPCRPAAKEIREVQYGQTEGQLGSKKGDTYWSAVALIYQQVFLLLPSGGAFAVVIKDFVRNKKRVPLCNQTAELLQTIGFDIPERIHAMLIKEIAQTKDMFTGKSDPKLIKRKSFFRRLAERKGAPPIDWEEVIWAVKP